MTPDFVEKLISAGESLDVEFKSESRGQLPDRQSVRADILSIDDRNVLIIAVPASRQPVGTTAGRNPPPLAAPG